MAITQAPRFLAAWATRIRRWERPELEITSKASLGCIVRGKAHGDLVHLVCGAAQAQLRKLERGVECHRIGVAYGSDLYDVGARQALHHIAHAGSVDAAQRGLELAHLGGKDAFE